PPIVGRYGKRPHRRMRRLQLRTVHDLISSPRAFAGRAAPKERLVDSAGVPAPRLTASGARALLLVSRAVSADRQPAALGFGSGNRLRWSSRAFALRGGRNDRGLTIDDGLRPGLVVVGADDGANVKLALLAGRDDVALARGDDALGLG